MRATSRSATTSPIPATAALLARERGHGRPYVSLLGSRRQSFFTDGGRELFDCAGQGRIDVFFLSGGQIDGEGNVNLVSIGDYEQPKVRFPGSFGSAYLYFVVPKVILFRARAHAPHAGRQGRFHQRAGQQAPTTSIAPAARSRSSPTAACSPSTASASASGWRACIPGTRSRGRRAHRLRPSTGPRRCRKRPRPPPRPCGSCAQSWLRSWSRSIRSSPKTCSGSGNPLDKSVSSPAKAGDPGCRRGGATA